MFLGQYDHSIDEKGRMTIPARFRELLEDGGYITAGLDQNLSIWPSDLFDRVYERVHAMSITNLGARLLRRKIFSNAARLEFDRSGRILLPQHLRQAACLEGNAVVVGSGETFEIWSPDLWLKQSQLFNSPEASEDVFTGLDLPLG